MNNPSSESSIDRRYREEYLRRLPTVDCNNNGSTWSFACPYCSEHETKEWKRNKKTACLIWNPVQNSWKFACQRCGKKTNFFHALQDLDPLLAARYQQKRDQSGTTGWGHDCPSTPSQRHLPSQTKVMPEVLQEGQEIHHAQQSPSAPRQLNRLTPQQQAGHQSRLNHQVKQHQQRKRKEAGDFWLS